MGFEPGSSLLNTRTHSKTAHHSFPSQLLDQDTTTSVQPSSLWGLNQSEEVFLWPCFISRPWVPLTSSSTNTLNRSQAASSYFDQHRNWSITYWKMARARVGWMNSDFAFSTVPKKTLRNIFPFPNEIFCCCCLKCKFRDRKNFAEFDTYRSLRQNQTRCQICRASESGERK